MVNITTGQMLATAARHHRDITSEGQHHLRAPIVVHKQMMTNLIWLASFVVIALGVAREFIIALIGIDSPLRELRHFALDSENSVPVWYSSALMTLAALLLWIISHDEKIKFRRRFSLWSILVVVFIAMSIDETSSFHEVLITPLHNAIGTTGIFHFSWMIVAIPMLAIFALYILPDLFKLPPVWIAKFVASGVVYITGALGMELVDGYFASSIGWDSTAYIVVATIEEILEIIGLTMFVGYLIEFAPALSIRFSR